MVGKGVECMYIYARARKARNGLEGEEANGDGG